MDCTESKVTALEEGLLLAGRGLAGLGDAQVMPIMRTFVRESLGQRLESAQSTSLMLQTYLWNFSRKKRGGDVETPRDKLMQRSIGKPDEVLEKGLLQVGEILCEGCDRKARALLQEVAENYFRDKEKAARFVEFMAEKFSSFEP